MIEASVSVKPSVFTIDPLPASSRPESSIARMAALTASSALPPFERLRLPSSSSRANNARWAGVTSSS
jgi:hypothetical protein